MTSSGRAPLLPPLDFGCPISENRMRARRGERQARWLRDWRFFLLEQSVGRTPAASNTVDLHLSLSLSRSLALSSLAKGFVLCILAHRLDLPPSLCSIHPSPHRGSLPACVCSDPGVERTQLASAARIRISPANPTRILRLRAPPRRALLFWPSLLSVFPSIFVSAATLFQLWPQQAPLASPVVANRICRHRCCDRRAATQLGDVTRSRDRTALQSAGARAPT
jgi:hypothetical protein